MHRTITLTVVVIAAVALTALAQDAAPPKSKAATEALRLFTRDKKELDDAYAVEITKHRAKLVERLQEARKAALAANGLDEAQAIVAAIKNAEADLTKLVPPAAAPDDPKAGEKEPAVPNGLVGSWTVNYTNKVTRVYTIKADMSITSASKSGKLVPDKRGGFMVDAPGERIERLSFAGERILLEVFSSSADIPKRQPVTLGVGYRN